MIHELMQLIAEYGLMLVFANVLAEQIGLPLPSTPALIIAGALAVDGKISALDLHGWKAVVARASYPCRSKCLKQIVQRAFLHLFIPGED